jgi:hypothetical protein
VNNAKKYRYLTCIRRFSYDVPAQVFHQVTNAHVDSSCPDPQGNLAGCYLCIAINFSFFRVPSMPYSEQPRSSANAFSVVLQHTALFVARLWRCNFELRGIASCDGNRCTDIVAIQLSSNATQTCGLFVGWAPLAVHLTISGTVGGMLTPFGLYMHSMSQHTAVARPACLFSTQQAPPHPLSLSTNCSKTCAGRLATRVLPASAQQARE